MPSPLNEALEWLDRAEQAREVAAQLTFRAQLRLPTGTLRVASPTCHSQSFGPSAIVSGLAYLLLRLSALECLTSLADGLAYYAVC